MAATIGLMSDDRLTLGGAGENLNEHVVAKWWPPANIRHLMLEEAIHAIRELWRGGYVSHRETSSRSMTLPSSASQTSRRRSPSQPVVGSRVDSQAGWGRA